MPKRSVLSEYMKDPESWLDEATDWYFLNKKYPAVEGETFPTEKARRDDSAGAWKSGRWREIRTQKHSYMEGRLAKMALKCKSFLKKYKQHKNPQSVATSEAAEVIKRRREALLKWANDTGLINEITILKNAEARAGHRLVKRRVEFKKELNVEAR